MKNQLIPARLTWGRGLLLLALSMPMWQACDKKDSESPQPTVVYGAAVQIGGGTGRSYVAADAQGKPTEIGLALTEAALTNLPATPATGTMYDVPLPSSSATSQLPFDHISFDWNPNGHEPAGVYTVPHFDTHFYMIPMSVQHAITLDDPKGDIFPASAMLPTGYMTPPNVAPGRTVPMMGRHWVDPTSPEYQPGGSFSKTFIYGTYNGHVTFLEPMFTKALLVPGVSVEEAVKQPQTYEVTGKYFPTSYSIRHDASTHEYFIALKGLTLR